MKNDHRSRHNKVVPEQSNKHLFSVIKVTCGAKAGTEYLHANLNCKIIVFSFWINLFFKKSTIGHCCILSLKGINTFGEH